MSVGCGLVEAAAAGVIAAAWHAALNHEGHQGAGCCVAKVRKATVGHRGHRVAKVWEATIGHHGKRCKGRGLWVG